MKVEDIIERLRDIKVNHVEPIVEERIFICDIDSSIREIEEALENLIDELKEEQDDEEDEDGEDEDNYDEDEV